MVMLASMAASCGGGGGLGHSRTDAGAGVDGVGGALGSGGNPDDAGFLCRPGDDQICGQLDTSCRGSRVSMTWPATVQFDTSGCTARTATDCVTGGVVVGGLDVQLLVFAQQSCHLPTYTFVMVEFVSGCPSVLRVGDIEGRADGVLVDCLSRELGQARWSCAEVATCSMVEWDTLP
jgi:hypothetical protein